MSILDAMRAEEHDAVAVPAARVELNRPTLEDVFVRIVTGEGGTGADDVVRLRAALRGDTAAEVGR